MRRPSATAVVSGQVWIEATTTTNEAAVSTAATASSGGVSLKGQVVTTPEGNVGVQLSIDPVAVGRKLALRQLDDQLSGRLPRMPATSLRSTSDR